MTGLIKILDTSRVYSAPYYISMPEFNLFKFERAVLQVIAYTPSKQDENVAKMDEGEIGEHMTLIAHDETAEAALLSVEPFRLLSALEVVPRGMYRRQHLH